VAPEPAPAPIAVAPEPAVVPEPAPEPLPALPAALVFQRAVIAGSEHAGDFDGTGRYLALRDEDGHVAILDLPSGTVRATRLFRRGPQWARFVVGARPSLLLCWETAHALERWDLATDETHAIEYTGSCRLALAPDRRRLAIDGAEGVCVRTLESAECAPRIPTRGRIAAIRWSPDGTALAIETDSIITVYDAATGEVRGRVNPPEHAHLVALGAGGRHVAGRDYRPHLFFYDAASGARSGTIPDGLQLGIEASAEAATFGWLGAETFDAEQRVMVAGPPRYVDPSGATVEPDAALRARVESALRISRVVDFGLRVVRGSTEIVRVPTHLNGDRVREVVFSPDGSAIVVAFWERAALYSASGTRGVPCLRYAEAITWDRGSRVSFSPFGEERRRVTADPRRCTAIADLPPNMARDLPVPERVATADGSVTAERRGDRVLLTRASDGARLWLRVMSDWFLGEMHPVVHTDDLRFEAADDDEPLVWLRREGPLLEAEVVPAASAGLRREGLLRAFLSGDPLP
jgi:hypothetical protein